jgi:selenocysteine-specific elongation factor
LGGGIVSTPVAEHRRKNAKVAVVQGDGILGLFSGREDGLLTRKIADSIGVDEGSLAGQLEELKVSGELLSFAGLWMTPEVEGRCRIRMQDALAHIHGRLPEKSLVPREEAVREAGFGWAGKVLDRLITYWVEVGVLRSRGTMIALTDHRPSLKPKQAELLARVVEGLSAAFPNVPAAHQIALEMNVPPQAAEQILQVGVDAGVLVRIEEGIFFPIQDLDKLKGQLKGRFGNNPFSASEFRDEFGTSRKYAIPILEYLDGIGFSVRMGDVRKVVG